MSTGPGLGGIAPSPLVSRLRPYVPRPMVRGALRVAQQYGEATAATRLMPDFLVIGTKKGGTTSLLNWLVSHPGVGQLFPPGQRLKSPHYFDINYWRGPTWYRAHFPTSRARSAQHKRQGTRPLIGEASPYYIFHPAVPGRVRETIPEARMIALLRDPVSRAYSNYWDRVATGMETHRTFESAIDAEPTLLGGISEEQLCNPRYYSFDHDNHSYLARGRYSEQLRRWFDVFPREQLLVMKAESLFADPAGAFRMVQQFLGLSGVESDSMKTYNARPDQLAMSATTHKRLAQYYRPHNAELYDLLGENYGWEEHYRD